MPSHAEEHERLLLDRVRHAIAGKQYSNLRISVLTFLILCWARARPVKRLPDHPSQRRGCYKPTSSLGGWIFLRCSSLHSRQSLLFYWNALLGNLPKGKTSLTLSTRPRFLLKRSPESLASSLSHFSDLVHLRLRLHLHPSHLPPAPNRECR